MAARKKKTIRKKPAARKKAPARKKKAPDIELPRNLREFQKRVRRGLTGLERKLETAQRDARRRGTKVLRDVSHEMGRLEARGEREWRKQTTRARRDLARMLHRLEKAVAPPARKRSRKRTARAAAAEGRSSGI